MKSRVPNGIITLTTDFGVNDIFVGVMKGIIVGINPKVQILDIVHEIKAYDVLAGSFLFNAAYKMFPPGTTHLVVVDPGVGGNRRGIAVQTDDYFFVAPDNGVLSEALISENNCHVVSLEATQYFRSTLSKTFHGRDIFAPVAAHLTLNVSLSKFGRIINDRVCLPLPSPLVSENLIEGTVKHIDRFGNIITNIDQTLFNNHQGTKKFIIEVKELKVNSLSTSYQEGCNDQPQVLFNSFNLLEIAYFKGNAAKQFGIGHGDSVQVQFYS